MASPMVPALTSTSSSLLVNLRSGVGIRTFFGINSISIFVLVSQINFNPNGRNGAKSFLLSVANQHQPKLPWPQQSNQTANRAVVRLEKSCAAKTAVGFSNGTRFSSMTDSKGVQSASSRSFLHST